jgi:tetratricopeptide (TPR) repeat protein
VAAAGMEERSASFRSAIAGLRLLVVLDNAADERQVRPLLPGSGSSAVIITSRRRLVALETARIVDIGLFSREESRALIDHVASRRRTSAEPAATDDVVRSCGGLPLAVRIAGARLAAQPNTSITTVARQLRDERRRLDGLRVGDLAVRTSIGLAYEALTTSDRRALRHLAHVGALSIPPSILNALLNCGRAQAYEVIERLASMRLLEGAGHDPGGEDRYRFHDLVRLFAHEQSLLTDSDAERRQATQRAARYWLAEAEMITAALPITPWTAATNVPQDPQPAPEPLRNVDRAHRAWFAAERRNLAAVIRLALAIGLVETAWRMVEAIASPSILYGEFDFIADLAGRAKRACDDTGDVPGSAAMVSLLASIDLNMCDYRSSVDRYATAYQLYAQLPDKPGMLFAATFAADAARALREYHDGCSRHIPAMWVNRALALSRTLDDPVSLADLAYVRGKLYLADGDLGQASEQIELCRRLAGELGKPVTEAHAVFRLGTIARLTGRPHDAVRAYRHVLEVNRDAGDRPGIGYLLLSLAEVMSEQGDRRTAAAYATEALDMFETLRLSFKADQALRLLSTLSVAPLTPASR